MKIKIWNNECHKWRILPAVRYVELTVWNFGKDAIQSTFQQHDQRLFSYYVFNPTHDFPQWNICFHDNEMPPTERKDRLFPDNGSITGWFSGRIRRFTFIELSLFQSSAGFSKLLIAAVDSKYNDSSISNIFNNVNSNEYWTIHEHCTSHQTS